MRLATIRTEGATTVGRLEGDEVVVLPFASMSELLRHADWRAAASTQGPRRPVDDVSFATTVDPTKTICVGLNYRTHIAETGKPQPQFPTLFAKFLESLTGPRSDIGIPPESHEVDWEVELGVVIGRPARKVSPADALDYVAGYTVVNDISMRDWQSRSTQWLQGKSFEASTPVGPCLVTPEEIDHARDLDISCFVDAEMVQRGCTSDLLFPPAELISYISTFITLMPGDLIATGTPGGTGMGSHPKRFLKPGEVLRSQIESIGALINRIVPGS